jgi:ferric-dicitrate binding protein FerR (iron transport regulator)
MASRAQMRSIFFYACTGLAVMTAFAASDWETIRTGSSPRRIDLPAGSYIEIGPRASANLTFIKSNPSIHLSSGRLNANLLAESKMSARLSASQVFVRASEGHFFIVNDGISGRTTVGVCRGTVNAFAGKGDSPNKSTASAGEFSIVAGEQAIISGDGTIVKEQDDAMDCTGF